MTRVLLAICVAATLGAAPSVSGKWSLDVDGGPHGHVDMALALTQDGTKVTGTFTSPHGEADVEGTFADNKLSLATVRSEMDVTFSGTLKPDDRIGGYMSSPMGDMTFTATRVGKGTP